MRGAWNDAFFAELEAFPEGGHDDQVDAAAEAFHAIRHPGDVVVAGSLQRETSEP